MRVHAKVQHHQTNPFAIQVGNDVHQVVDQAGQACDSEALGIEASVAVSRARL